jgi:hypothetical protein
MVWALTNPSPSRTVQPAGTAPAVARFDAQTGRPIKGYDPATGEPIYDDQ